MKFELRPILAEMKELYLQPLSVNRFKEYIARLQGDTKGDLSLPISGFNPMAKEHILQKIEELERLEAEQIMQEVIEEFNATINEGKEVKIVVVLNLADDLKGGWTNHYTTDFESKFKLNALVNRNFCNPYFWSSEIYTKELIKERTKAYLYRTLYWLSHLKPITLEDHFRQEVFVAERLINELESHDEDEYHAIKSFYEAHKKSEAYDLIFNFFYGDLASESLGYKTYGITDKTGFDLAKFIA